MKQPIRGKVARILNSREVALKIGSRDGVGVDMYFDILDPQMQDISDPDSEEVLGSILRPKVRVRVTWVDDRLSVATTFRKTTVNVGGQMPDVGLYGLSSFSRALMPQKWVTKYETLKSRDTEMEPLAEDESFVGRGDAVVEVPHKSDDPVYSSQRQLSSGVSDVPGGPEAEPKT